MSTAGWIAFALFSGFAAMLLAVGLREWRLQKRLLAHARPVEGTVLSVEIRRSTSRDSDPAPGRSTSTTSYTRIRRLNQKGSMSAVNTVLVLRQAAAMLAVLILMAP